MNLLGSTKVMAIYVKHHGGQSGISCCSKVPTGQAGKDEIKTARAILNRELKGKRGDKHVEFNYGAWNGS